MNAPRKLVAAVDVQIDDFELNLRERLEYQLIFVTDRDFWLEFDTLNPEDFKALEDVIDLSFINIINLYKNVTSVVNILQHSRILFQNIVWAGMNTPFPHNIMFYIDRVIDNAFEVYFNVVYPNLRTEMLTANRRCFRLQQTWRRCYYEPDHPVCRRRLLREFEELDAPSPSRILSPQIGQ